jgi:hypothetical protein
MMEGAKPLIKTEGLAHTYFQLNGEAEPRLTSGGEADTGVVANPVKRDALAAGVVANPVKRDALAAGVVANR